MGLAKSAIAASGFLFCITGIAAAGKSQIPVKELVSDSTAIVAGKIVVQERVTISPGVVEVTQHILLDEVLKGQPLKTELTTLGTAAAEGKDSDMDEQKAETLRIRFFDGPNVPSGKIVYGLGHEGIWFLYEGDEYPRGVYQASARHDFETRDELGGLLADEARRDRTRDRVRQPSSTARAGNGEKTAISVREAIDLAERFVKDHKIDVSGKRVGSVILKADKPAATPGPGPNKTATKFWIVTYQPERVEGKGGEIYLHVNMAGDVQVYYGE